MFRNKRILCCILNHNQNATAYRLYNIMYKLCDTYILDAESDKIIDHPSVIKFSNIYWGGLYNEECSLFLKGDYDWLFSIDADIKILSSGFKFRYCVNQVSKCRKIGLYKPGFVDGSNAVWEHSRFNPYVLKETDFIEQNCMMIHRSIVEKHNKVDLDYNKYGWGVDFWLVRAAKELGLKIVTDHRLKIFHPFTCSYDRAEAIESLRQVLKKEGLENDYQIRCRNKLGELPTPIKICKLK